MGLQEADNDRPRVLMIDDSELALEFQEMLLRRAGFAVRAIESLDALAEVEPAWPQFVLVDANMPDASAEEVCAAARKQHPKAMIVLVSGLEPDALRPLATRCAADGFVSKSDGIEQLPSVLRSMQASRPQAPSALRSDRLRERFRSLARERNATVRELLAALAEGNGDPANHRSQIQRLLHTTKGEAGLLGMTEVARLTGALEEAFEEKSAAARDSETSIAALHDGLAQLDALLA